MAALLCLLVLAGLIYEGRRRYLARREYLESWVRMDRELADVPGWSDERR